MSFFTVPSRAIVIRSAGATLLTPSNIVRGAGANENVRKWKKDSSSSSGLSAGCSSSARISEPKTTPPAACA